MKESVVYFPLLGGYITLARTMKPKIINLTSRVPMHRLRK